jgi:hypothetical protein
MTPPDDDVPSLPAQLKPLTLAHIRKGLSADERLWLARMISAYGEAHVLQYWESYKMQIDYIRNF